jgi:hypothetical protein
MGEQSTTEQGAEIRLGGFGLLVESRERVQFGFRRRGCRSRYLVDVVHDFEYAEQGSVRMTGWR